MRVAFDSLLCFLLLVISSVAGHDLSGLILQNSVTILLQPELLRTWTLAIVTVVTAVFGAIFAAVRPSASPYAYIIAVVCFLFRLPVFGYLGQAPIHGVLVGMSIECILVLAFVGMAAFVARAIPVPVVAGILAIAILGPLSVESWLGSGVQSALVSITLTPLGSRPEPGTLIPSTFQDPHESHQELSWAESLEWARREGTIKQDPDLQLLRSTVVERSDAALESPCDLELRSRLRAAILHFLNNLPSLQDRPGVELFTANGRTQQISGLHNGPAFAIVRQAFRDGTITFADAPEWVRVLDKGDPSFSRDIARLDPSPLSASNCR